MRALPLLLAATLLAGCAQRVGSLGGADVPAPDPFYKEHRATIGPQHDVRYPVVVTQRAALLNATLTLRLRDQGLQLPGLAPAQLTVQVLDPAGGIVQEATLDAQHTAVTLLVERFDAPGTWHVRVAGSGASGELDGDRYGAEYVLAIELLSL